MSSALPPSLTDALAAHDLAESDLTPELIALYSCYTAEDVARQDAALLAWETPQSIWPSPVGLDVQEAVDASARRPLREVHASERTRTEDRHGRGRRRPVGMCLTGRHVIDTVGRTAEGACAACRREYHRTYQAARRAALKAAV